MADRSFEARIKSAVGLKDGVVFSQEGGQHGFFTRRKFIATSSVAGASMTLLGTRARAQAGGGTSITSNFNGTPIPGGDWIWFSAVLKVHGLGSVPVTIGFMSSIQFSVGGVLYVIPVPSGLLTFSPNMTVATTTFTNGSWVTTVPISGLAGNVFVTGVALQSPLPSGFPGGINPVTWQGTFVSMTPGLTVDWQWAAAVYESPAFGSDYTLLGVKPVDDNRASIYQDSDHAGTPENFKHSVVGGARGGGGSNFTGSMSATASTTPTPANMGGGSGS